MALCRELDLLSEASVAIDGSKFKAINARDKNFTEAKMKRRLERIDESIARYMAQLETADRRGDAVPEAKVVRLRDKIVKLREEVARLSAIKAEMMKSEDKQISLTDPDARSMATSGNALTFMAHTSRACEAEPSDALRDQTDPLEPAGRRFANFFLVFHRALPDLQRMKHKPDQAFGHRE